jgi:PTS system fructose-specific IIC component
MAKIVAVTACPTGVAHTYMAAEALIKAAKDAGVSIKVETRGAVGVENQLTEAEISEAVAVIVAADTDADEARFAGKAVVRVGVAAAIKNGPGLIEEALNVKAPAGGESLAKKVEEVKSTRSAGRTGAYKHLMNGVSAMIPLVVAGGILIAICFAFGIHAFQVGDKSYNKFADYLMQIGGGSAFGIMVPILSGFIASSIADKPGLAPGLIGGMLAKSTGAGFLGGIIAGFLAGYVAKFLKEQVKLPRTLEGLKPIIIIPVVASFITGILMLTVIGEPIKSILDHLTNWLKDMQGSNRVLLGLLLGGMMAFDMGGPVNKVAYTFAVGLLGENVFLPMAAVMAAGMTPPLGVWLATVLAPKKFTAEERDAGKSALVLGVSFITEGAIPFAAADPGRVIPSIVIGSAITGALSMAFKSGLHAPHGGIWILPIPHVLDNWALYILAIAIGTVVTGLLLSALKKNVEA